MKLRYTISEKTKLEPYVVKAHILLKLKDENYRVQDITEKCVTFDYSSWKLTWRHEAIRKLDKGKFEFAPIDKQTEVTLTHYFSLWPQLMMAGVAIFSSINANDYLPIWFFGSFIIITTVINYFTLKSVGREMLQDIIKVSDSTTANLIY